MMRALLILRDLCAPIGLALLGYGCWLAWEPLGFIVPGALLIAFAVVSVLREPAPVEVGKDG